MLNLGNHGDDTDLSLAVALHGIEPATYERCALIRDWLSDEGVDRVTLLVIPARDLHPVGERSPEMVEWLLERRQAGDAIAQHGFRHERLRRSTPGGLGRFVSPRPAGEFVGLDEEETRRAVEAGWRVLKLAGIEPEGFVAPAYAYTPALHRALARRFHWWAGLRRLYRAPTHPVSDPPARTAAIHPFARGSASDAPIAPAWSLGRSRGPLRRALSPTFVRIGGRLARGTLRLDLHPAYLEHPRHILALEGVLRRAARGRHAVTYRELLYWEPENTVGPNELTPLAPA
jgi:uncharacterized protein